MQSQWRDEDAAGLVTHYASRGVHEDLALRVYTSRLLGRDPRLVLHGGGNTSVKTAMADLTGDDVEVLCVKGSGWDLADIEPPGLPALRLAPLRKLVALESLSDEDMVNLQRGQLLDSTSPNPSVETLLHAFLPEKFVDHTHANAVLAVTDQPDGVERSAELYAGRAAVVPYVMPGFALAKLAARVHDEKPGLEGLILLKHGIFSFGADAREAYERMIGLVTIAEAHLERASRTHFVSAAIPTRLAPLSEVAPILRGALAECIDTKEGLWRRQVLAVRQSEPILAYVNGAELARYSQVGVVTPDHTIRTKNWPLVVPAPEAGKLADFAAAVGAAVEAFVQRYHDYFQRHNARAAVSKVALDPLPRVILVPGLGLVGLGKSAKDAHVAADIAEATVEVISAAEANGGFAPVSESDMFDIEYWSLEQAKLGKGAEPPLARHVVLVTGAGGGIGEATARAFASRGAELALIDRDGMAVEHVAKTLGSHALAIACDVTDPASVRAAFDRACESFGGVDIVVSNAGAAWQGKIGEVAEADLRASFELNFFAHQDVAQNAVRIMRAQGTGGVLLFNASKQAVNPGPDFGPYGAPKAATLFLARQYAVDHGAEGIRSNAVNADRVRTGLYTEGLLEERAAVRGLSVEDYLAGGNLLKREVTAEDVAEAFVSLALARKTTGAVLTVDGGNIAAAPR